MTLHEELSSAKSRQKLILKLHRLLDQEVLANPYPLYQYLRTEDPVHWDLYLHTWIVTQYTNVITVFQFFFTPPTPTPEQLTALGLSLLTVLYL